MVSVIFCFQFEAYNILGTLQTPATWIRKFIRSHPAYKFDSVVSQEINYDLMVAVDDMQVTLNFSYLVSDFDLLIVSGVSDENQNSSLKTTTAVLMTKVLLDCNENDSSSNVFLSDRRTLTQ